MTFKLLMDYAHQGIELRQIPGVTDIPAEVTKKPEAVAAKKEDGQQPADAFIRPRMLTVPSTRTVRKIGDRLKDATPLKMQEKVASAE